MDEIDELTFNELKMELRKIIRDYYGFYCSMCGQLMLGKVVCECGADLKKQRIDSYDLDLTARRGYMVPMGDGTSIVYPRRRNTVNRKQPIYPKIRI